MNGQEKLMKIKENILKNRLAKKTTANLLTSLVFKLNKMCNLNCSYCYVDCETGGPQIKLEVFKKILSSIDLNKYSGDRKLVLILHGGEPLISYQLIKDIVQYIQKNGLDDHISINLQSNGVLINEEMIAFFKKHNIGFGISIDGYNDHTNVGRVFYDGTNSFTAVDKAIDLCIKNDFKPGIATVISHSNVDYMLEFCEYLKNKGINSVVFNVLVPHGRASSLEFPVEKYIEASKKVYDWMNEQSIQGFKITERNLDHLHRKIFNGGSNYMCLNAPCGAGINTLGFDLDGSIYICDQFVGDENFIIGHIDKNLKQVINEPLSIKLIKQFQNRDFSHIESCVKCSYRYICPLGCPAQVVYRDKSLSATPPLCEYYKAMITYMISKKGVKACSD